MTVELYHGDCLEIMKTLPDGCVDAVITDPPYGIDVATNYRERKRGSLALCNNFVPIVGDNEPFDPKPFLCFKTVVLFGANYFAKSLPDEGAWLVWDKLDGLSSSRTIGFNDNSDCEFLWTNKGRAARILRHRWMGAMKGSECAGRRVHPTQKPIALMVQIIEHYTHPNDTVFDPFMGSGTTGIACVRVGRNFIGCEIDENYFNVAKRRIEQAQMQMIMPLGESLSMIHHADGALECARVSVSCCAPWPFREQASTDWSKVTCKACLNTVNKT